MTGIWGNGKTLKTVEINVENKLMCNIICCPVGLNVWKIWSWVLFTTPSSNKFAKRYPIPMSCAQAFTAALVGPPEFL